MESERWRRKKGADTTTDNLAVNGWVRGSNIHGGGMDIIFYHTLFA